MKILVTTRITDEQLESLRQVISSLDEEQAASSEKRLGLAPGSLASAEIAREVDPKRAAQLLRDADILYCFPLPGPLEEARSLKWIQLVSAGAEHLFEAGIRRKDILVTTASGIHGVAMAEYTLCMMVMLARRMPLVLRESERREWKPSRLRTYYGGELRGSSLGIVGLGTIGGQVAETARALGMRVIGLRLSGMEGPADRVYSPEGLLELLSESDHVLVALPLTEATRNFIGERELRAMKRGAFLINVARGGIVDETALATALREGWIAGAAFDVFAEEPLSPDSELWDLPNLIITPHMAGNTLPYLDRATEIFRENLRRYLLGEPMINVLNKERGY